METIYKTLDLETAKNRCFSNLPYYVPGNPSEQIPQSIIENWGQFVGDLELPDSILSGEYSALTLWVSGLTNTLNIKYDDVNHKYSVRYKNLMNLYYWLVNVFIPSITFYQRCFDGYRVIDLDVAPDEVVPSGVTLYEPEVEFIPPHTLEFYNGIAAVELPKSLTIFQLTARIVGDTLYLDKAGHGEEYIGVTSLYDEFIEKFQTLENAQSFLIFMLQILSNVGGLFGGITTSTPYIDVNFSLANTQVDMGVLTPYSKEWIPGKKYFLGDIVIYNNKTWRLEACKVGNYDLVEAPSEYGNFLISDSGSSTVYTYIDDIETFYTNEKLYRYAYYTQPGQTQVIYHSNNYEYKFFRPFDAGNFNQKTGVIEFNTKSWLEIPSVVPSSYSCTGITESCTGITESKLSSFVRQKVSVDDSGNTLPFIVPSADTQNTEMIYGLGIANMVDLGYSDTIHDQLYDNDYDGAIWLGDYLSAVTFNVNGSTYIVSSGTTILCLDLATGTTGTINFDYLIGATVVVNTGNSYHAISNTGIHYNETWDFSIETITTIYENHSHTFKYVNIYPSNIIPVDENNLDLNGKIPILSNIEYQRSGEVENLHSNVFKEECLMGTQFVNSDVDAFIERGTAASFERHNILGEIKTFEDLENYRNNFFQI